MSRNESVQAALNDLLQWERPSTKRNDMFEGDVIELGPFDAFVDKAAQFVQALHEFNEIDAVLDRAKRFESLLAPGSELDSARVALQPIVKAFSDGDSKRGVEWDELHPPRIWEDDRPWRRAPGMISSDEVALIRDLGTSTDCLRWSPSKSQRQMRDLLSRRLVPPLPVREGLERFENLLGEFWQFVEENAVWGCWLLVQCEAACESPAAFDELIRQLTDTHVRAIKSAARCVGQQIVSQLSRSQTATNKISDKQDKLRAMLSFVDGKPVVRFGGKNCDISRGKSDSLLNLLYGFQAKNLPPTYKAIFETVYPSESYNPDSAGAAPEKLRKLAQRLNDALKDKLALPPDGKPWIRTISGHGYCLTDAVTWQAKADWQEHDFERLKLNAGR